MRFFGYGEVVRAHHGFPVSDGVLTSQRHDNNGAGAHEGRQAGKEELSVLVCVKLTALLRTQQQPALLSQGKFISRQFSKTRGYGLFSTL